MRSTPPLTPLTRGAIAQLNGMIAGFDRTKDQRENLQLEKLSQFSLDLFRQNYVVNNTSFPDYVLALSDEEFIRVAQLSQFDVQTCQPVLDYLHEIKKYSSAQLKKEKISNLFDKGFEKSPLAKILFKESQKNENDQPDPFYISFHSVIKNWMQSCLRIKTNSENLITSLITAYDISLISLDVFAQKNLSKIFADITYQANLLVATPQKVLCHFSKTLNNKIDFSVTISPRIWSLPRANAVGSKFGCILGKLKYTLRFDLKNKRFKLISCKTTGGFLEKLMSGDYENEAGTEEELKNKIYQDLLVAYQQNHNYEPREKKFQFYAKLAKKMEIPIVKLLHGQQFVDKKLRGNFFLPENADYKDIDLRGIDLSKVKNINRVKSLKGAQLDKQQVEFLAKNYPHLLTGTDLRGVVYLESLDLYKIDLSGITIDQNTILNLTSSAVPKDDVNQRSAPQPAASAPLNNNFNYVFKSGAKVNIANNNSFDPSSVLSFLQLYQRHPNPTFMKNIRELLYTGLKNNITNLDDTQFKQLVRASHELNTPLDLSNLNLTNINLCEYDLSKVDFTETIFHEPINLHNVGLHNLSALARDGILTKETKITLGESKSYTVEELVSAFCKQYNEKREEEINTGWWTPRFFANKLKSDFVHSQLKEGDKFAVENLIKILQHAHQKPKSRTTEVLGQVLIDLHTRKTSSSNSNAPEQPTSSRDSLTP